MPDEEQERVEPDDAAADRREDDEPDEPAAGSGPWAKFSSGDAEHMVDRDD